MPTVDMKHPLKTFISKRAFGKHQVPLKKTSYDIEVVSGLAIVRSTRVFKNVEKRPIEATMTFPVPFDAAVYEIQAKVDGRVLTGKAQAALKARETYENAIDDGKRAVLHEELLRGLHMLSVGNVAPGVEIEVTAAYVVPVVLTKGNGSFRIPLTVGQIYGVTPLEDSDDIATGGDVKSVSVTITADRGTVQIGGKAVSKKTKVQSNQAIEARVIGLYVDTPSSLSGVSADGKIVNLDFKPISKAKSSLNMHMLLDVSGSMNELVSSNSNGDKTKWDAVLGGVDEATDEVVKSADRITVSTFSSQCTIHGSTTGDRLSSYVRSLPIVSGGTNLAEAVAKVVSYEKDANVLLVTDGKSWNKIDVQAAIASGARFTVVLVGEDSLEINVGYLAAMTGGQMFIVRGANVRKAISAAIKSMRDVSSPIVPIKAAPAHLTRKIAGVEISASFKAIKHPESVTNDNFKQAVGAFAASLAVQAMEEEAGAVYAAEAGLVTHLTSIVLVDEEVEAVDGIPATRKVALPEPATASRSIDAFRSMSYAAAAPQSLNLVASSASQTFMSASPNAEARTVMTTAALGMSEAVVGTQNTGWSGTELVLNGIGPLIGGRETTSVNPWQDFSEIPNRLPICPLVSEPMKIDEPSDFKMDMDEYTKKMLGLKDDFAFPARYLKKSYDPKSVAKLVLNAINWEEEPDLLLKGDTSRLSRTTQIQMLGLSQEKAIKKLAKSLNISEMVALIAVLANQVKNRTAARIARAVLADVKLKKLASANDALGF